MTELVIINGEEEKEKEKKEYELKGKKGAIGNRCAFFTVENDSRENCYTVQIAQMNMVEKYKLFRE